MNQKPREGNANVTDNKRSMFRNKFHTGRWRRIVVACARRFAVIAPAGLAAFVAILFTWNARCDSPPARNPPNIIVVFADDLGYADVGAQRVVNDVRTPHLDRLAAEGVRCTAGYVTAPQCTPSRAGLITGRYQQRFGLDSIPDGPLPLEETTIAERLRPAGYTCGMVGKWHLEPTSLCKTWAAKHLPNTPTNRRGHLEIPQAIAREYYPGQQGFDEFFVGTRVGYWCNFDLEGRSRAPQGEAIRDDRFRVDVQSDAAVSFIERNAKQPFFLYLCYFAPHIPLEATSGYLDRFPSELSNRRRHALAMVSAMDDGVGRILDTLQKHGIDENTLIIFTSDNGAPLKLTKEDLPLDVDGAVWDGSLNDPWVGEKGMLSEGGIRVPYLLRWKGTLPAGLVYSEPVTSLDIAATAANLADLPADAQLDGVNLIPYLKGTLKTQPHDALYWRFWNQAAIRAGKWKYLTLGNGREFLFDLSSDSHEK